MAFRRWRRSLHGHRPEEEMESAQQPHGKLGKEGTQCECKHGTGVMKEKNDVAYSGLFFFLHECSSVYKFSLVLSTYNLIND